MNKPIKSRRGGPRTFNRDDAVETAMRLFWRHGYEGVSVSDLTTAIGIAPPSLYSAFGSKAALYRETLDRYRALPGALDGLADAKTLDQVVETLFQQSIAAALAFPDERGCMVSSGMVECAAEHAGLAHDVAARRGAIRDAIAVALSRWLDGPAAHAAASYLSALLQGISVQARDGAQRAELESIARYAMAAFRSTDTQPPKKSSGKASRSVRAISTKGR